MLKSGIISYAQTNYGYKEFMKITPNLGSNGISANLLPISSVKSPKIFECIYILYTITILIRII